MWGTSAKPRTVLVVPCSSSHRPPVPPWDVDVSDNDCFDADRVVAYTSLVQPVLKSDLVKHYGNVDGDTLAELRTRLMQLLDVTEVPDDAIDDL